jgi:hypothetical protein
MSFGGYAMRTILVFLLCWGSAIGALSAQDQMRDEERAKQRGRASDFGERLGEAIEEFIERMNREFQWDTNQVDDRDTIRSRSPKRETHTFDGNTVIGADEFIKGDVIVKGGNLTVLGEVEGDVLVVGGTLYVKDGGRIRGNARVISGDIVREEGGVIDGYMDKARSSTASYRQETRRSGRSSYLLSAPWVPETANIENFIFRYNRVDGLFLGLGSEKKYYWDGSRSYNAYGSLGYAFKLHRWRYHLGLTRQFAVRGDDAPSSNILEFGIEGHSITDTKDQWLINVHENTAAALLIHEDFRDYFGRQGFGAHIAHTSQKDYLLMQLKVEYLADRYTSLSKRTEYAIFGGNKVFRPNPPIDEGHMRSALVTAGLSTVSKTSRGQEGWSVFASAEFAARSWGSEFNFSQLLADIRRYQPLGRYDNVNFRLRAGTSTGSIPAQRIFEVGGLGTLNARPFKSEAGNRMVLANLEYIVNGDFLQDLNFWPSWLMRGINFLLVADAGWIASVPARVEWTHGFETLKPGRFKNDLGFGVSNKNGSFRFGFVWRTDVKAPAVLLLRFTRPF